MIVQAEHPIPRHVLLVDDSAGDVRLTREAFRDANSTVVIHVANDGVDAMAFLHRENPHGAAPRPDLILLDLNLPRMDGREVLAQVKADEELKTIPTIILTTSDAQADIIRSYELQANGYVSKPAGLDEFEELIRSVDDFWLSKAKLPSRRADL
jgi:CheY-like chemotaxis protein